MVSMRMQQRGCLPAQGCTSSVQSLSGVFAMRRPNCGLRRQSTLQCGTAQAATAVQHASGTTAAAPALQDGAAATALQELMQRWPDNVHDGIYTCSIPKLCNTSSTATFIAATLQHSPPGAVLRLRAAGPAAVAQALRIIAKASAIIQQQTEGCYSLVFEPQREMLKTDLAGRWTVDLDKSRFNVMDFYLHKTETSTAAVASASSSGAAAVTAKSGSHGKPMFISKATVAVAVKDAIVKALRKQQSLTCSAIGVGNVKNLVNGIAWARQQLQASGKQPSNSLQCTVTFKKQQRGVKSANAAGATAADTSTNQQCADQQQQQHHVVHDDRLTRNAGSSSSSGGSDSGGVQGQPDFVMCFEVTVRPCEQNVR